MNLHKNFLTHFWEKKWAEYFFFIIDNKKLSIIVIYDTMND